MTFIYKAMLLNNCVKETANTLAVSKFLAIANVLAVANIFANFLGICLIFFF